MRLIRKRRGALLAVAAGSMALVTFTATSAAASMEFCGAGRGPTAQVAIDSALDDARNSAQSVGLYGPCAIVGEPDVAEYPNDPNYGHIFRASLIASCEA